MAARRRRARSRSKASREFVSEAEEILEQMRGALADLADRAGGAEIDPDVLNGLFRSAHSLKALAGLFGLDPIGELAHRLEDVLDGMRLGRISPDGPALGLVDEAVERLAGMLGDPADARSRAASAELLACIDAALAGEAPDPADPASHLDPALLRALTEYEEHRLRENIRRGRRVLLVEAAFEISCFEEGLGELTQAVREVGEVISTLPSPGEVPEQQIRFGLLVATEVDPERLASRLDLPAGAVTPVHEPPGRGAAARAAAPSTGSPPPGEAVEIASLRSVSDTVRVDIRKLDELMNLVGELVIQRSTVGGIARQLAGETATARIGMELEKAHKTLERKIQELQAGVLEVRMVPLRQVFDKLSRVVRRLRHDLGKEVRLEVSGADTELDKLLVEGLVDPLMHVVRNAFDHAIEPPEERTAAGKPPEGCIRLEAFQRGNHVVIQVSDDGRGIDADAVRQDALRRGLIAPEDELGRRELLDLVFQPGLSTRSCVTETSGRGVGMDVVKSNLTSLGGAVAIDSQAGRGSVITMTLPITLAIIQALIVGVGDQRYAIPLPSVLETLPVDPSEIQGSEGREILNLRGEPLVLRRLAAEFALSGSDPEAKSHAVVIGLGATRLGLLVDRLEGQQDAVIKPVQGPVPDVRGIAGATELGDGEPVLLLDAAAVVEDALRRREAA